MLLQKSKEEEKKKKKKKHKNDLEEEPGELHSQNPVQSEETSVVVASPTSTSAEVCLCSTSGFFYCLSLEKKCSMGKGI